MSGIGGWIDFENSVYSEDKSMALMLKTLKSRGTGETGKACIWKTNECYFLNHTLINRSGKEYIITCDGQLYNAGDVRLKLIKLGYSFDGYSDEEIILVAYIEWGADCLHEFNGTFAFAIWDSGKNELFIARDRVGVKPLFFYKYEHGLIFGSEIKSLLSHEWVPREINAEGIASLMLLGPARKCGFAVFKGIDEIQPGCFGVFSRGGFDTCRYWHIKAERHNESFEETSEHLRMLIIDSVERQLCSETPVCSLLSGGLDSSIITVIAAANLKTHGKQLSTYSVDYKDNNKNFKSSAFQPDEDAPWIEEMSRFAGTLQKNIIIDTDELSNALYDAVEARDLPGMADVDSSLYLFLKAVGNDFKIGLSGECADEILGGYPWYHNDEILFDSGFPWSRSVKERSDLLKSGVLGDINAREYVDLACRETIRATDYLGNDTRKEHRIREMFMLNFYWFMQTLIDRGDRMAAANGFALRMPFCDYRIVEYAYNIPWEMRAFNGREKGLVRHSVEDLLPAGVAWRKKSPYPKTHNPLYMNRVTEMVNDIVKSSDCRISEILDMDKIKKLADSNGAGFEKNWYGQLMQAPQMFAYLIQLEYWLKHYDVKIVK